MTEQKPERANGIGRPWDLRISRKTPHSVLAERNSVNLSYRIAGDMIKTVSELAPGTDWDKILGDFSFCNGQIRGKTAIEKRIAQNLRLVAIQMGWGMDTPQVVCLTGLFFIRVIDRSTAERSARLKDPNRKFISGEARTRTIEREEGEIAGLGHSRKLLEHSIRNFARKKITRSERYLEQLQDALGLLLSGKTEEAETLLSNPPSGKLEGPKRKKPSSQTPPIPQERAIVVFVANPQPIT